MRTLVLVAGAVLLAQAGANDILVDIASGEVGQDTTFFKLDPFLAQDGEIVGLSSANGALYHNPGGVNINHLPGGYPGQGYPIRPIHGQIGGYRPSRPIRGGGYYPHGSVGGHLPVHGGQSVIAHYPGFVGHVHGGGYPIG